MRIMSLALALVLGLTVSVVADDKKKEGKLAVGDPAPAITVDKWMQGDEVKSFEKGKIYIVEFWATWCGPCIVMMPHLSELQQEYKSKGVTFIGFTSKDRNGNNEEKVAEFVKKRGPKLKYTFAYEETRKTNDAYMKAAGQNGIPCCFVVDKAGKVAYIGHPMYLDVVLPKVVAGKWSYEKGPEEMKKVAASVNEVFKSMRGKEPEETLKIFADFEKEHPKLSKIPYFTGSKLSALIEAKKTDEAKKMAKELLAKAIKQDDPTAMRTVNSATRNGTAKESKDMLAISLEAAEALLKASGEKDAMALFTLADTYFSMGDRTKAVENCKKAIENAPNPNTKKFLEGRLKIYEEKKEA